MPPEYTAQVLVPWGTPLVAGIDWAKDASNTSAEQEQQVGFNHDGIHFYPLSNGRRGNSRGVLVMNHEYTDASQIYTAAQGSTITADTAGLEKVAKALAGHGVTVVEVRQNSDGFWTHVEGSPYNRRITGTTPVAFTGLQFSWPPRWHYDVLRALDHFRRSGAAPDPRVAEAVQLVRDKRQSDGTWLLESTHPGEVQFEFEDGDGHPSRWNTLRALRVLDWHDRSR